MYSPQRVSNDCSDSAHSTSASINLFCVADEAFALPLAAALESALLNVRSADQIQIVVADDGIRPEDRQKIVQLVANVPVDATIRFVVPDTDVFERCPTSDWHKPPVYLRLLVDDLVPANWKKVIYFDADVVVRGDLGELWRAPMEDHVLLAAQDFRYPTVNDRISLRDAYLKDYGMSPNSAYFQTGVLVIDLEAWRRKDVFANCMRFLEAYPEEIEYGDQDALNGALAGEWGQLEPTWNLAMNAIQWYGWPRHETAENRERQAQLLQDPMIVHFSGASKPWHHLYRRSMGAEFFEYLSASRWFGPWQWWLWAGERRLAHYVLRHIPDTFLDTAKKTLRV